MCAHKRVNTLLAVGHISCHRTYHTIYVCAWSLVLVNCIFSQLQLNWTTACVYVHVWVQLPVCWWLCVHHATIVYTHTHTCTRTHEPMSTGKKHSMCTSTHTHTHADTHTPIASVAPFAHAVGRGISGGVHVRPTTSATEARTVNGRDSRFCARVPDVAAVAGDGDGDRDVELNSHTRTHTDCVKYKISHLLCFIRERVAQ